MTTPAWSEGFRSGERSTSKVLRLLVGLRAQEVDLREPSPMMGLSSTSNCTLLRLARGTPAIRAPYVIQALLSMPSLKATLHCQTQVCSLSFELNDIT